MQPLKRETRAPSLLKKKIYDTDDSEDKDMSPSPDVSDYIEESESESESESDGDGDSGSSGSDGPDTMMTSESDSLDKKKQVRKAKPAARTPASTSTPKRPRTTPTLGTWGSKETTMVVNKLAEIILDHRTEVYAVPELKQWSGNGGSAINQRIKQILQKGFGPMGLTLEMPKGAKRGNANGGSSSAGSPRKKAKGAGE